MGTCCGGSCDSRVDGEPKGHSKVGDDDREDNREDGKDCSDDLVVVGVIDGCMMVDDLSQLEEICPWNQGCNSQCLEVEGASLYYQAEHGVSMLYTFSRTFLSFGS